MTVIEYLKALGKSFQLLHGQGIGGSVMSVLPAGASKALAAGVSAMEKLKKVSSSNSPITLVPGLVNTSGLTIQSSTNPTAKAKTNQQPSISITPLPRSTAAASVIQFFLLFFTDFFASSSIC